jgi:DNA polymerase-3 subunit delta
MTPHQLLADISAGKFKPVYYFFGQEDYRIIEAEKYLASQFLPKRQLTTNYRRLNGKKSSTNDLIAELSVYPMLGERQVFGITDFQSYKPTEIKRILKLLTPTDPNRIVVLSSPADKAPKKNSAFFKTMSQAAEVVEFQKLTAAETQGFVRGKLEKAGMTIEPGALELITELIAGNRGALEAEVEKLVNYKTEEGSTSVTEEDIRRLTTGFEVYTVFELADHIIAGDTRKVLNQIAILTGEGTNPTGILWHLGNHFVSLYLVKNGKPLDARRRWLTGRFRLQTGKYSNAALEKMIIEIAETDSALRHSSGVKGEMQLESLVLQLMRAAG